MKRFIFLALGSLFFNGCLVGHKIVYEVVPHKAAQGTAAVYYVNIRSDAANSQQFAEDKKNLFEYMLNSEQFIQDMKKEGKGIVTRELYLENNKLNGKAVYNFDKLEHAENLAYDDGFYFLTVGLGDSVLSTNGEIIKSATYKRILWNENTDTLKFEILTEPAENAALKDLAPFFKP